jgi:hypothetical protein
MVLNVTLATLFGKLLSGGKSVFSTVKSKLFGDIGDGQHIFVTTPSGGFITIPRGRGIIQQINLLEKLNNRLAQIHATISRTAMTINSPLVRIWNMLERLFRTIFLPIELILSSLLLPLLPILRTLVRLSVGTLLPIAINVFKWMMENKESFIDFLSKLASPEWLIKLLFGEGKGEGEETTTEETKDERMEQLEEIMNPWKKAKEQAEEKQNESKSTWEEIWNWISGKKILETVKSTFDNNPFVQNIKDFVWNNLINPVSNYIGNFRNPLDSMFVKNIKDFVWNNMINPVGNFLAGFRSPFNFPFVTNIGQFVWTNMINPVANFLAEFGSAIWNHPVVVGIRQFIHENVIKPISELIATIQNKFNEFKNNLPAPLQGIWNAIENLFNEIQNRIRSLINTLTFGIFSGFIGGSSVGGGGGGSKTTWGSVQSHTIPQPKISGPAHRLQHGGTLFEPLIGFGLHTGRTYTLAEKQPELVTPVDKVSGGISGIVININVNGNIIGINDFENRIKQVVETELRRVR